MNRSYVDYYFQDHVNSSQDAEQEEYFQELLAHMPTRQEKKKALARKMLEELAEVEALQDALEEYPLS